MGIRGLTTFINNRSHLYLKDHELHDCNVVIDGNSLASNLYKWHCKSNDCFGGDYDKFAHVIRNFFDILSQCNINPYVILDGGYEKRKLNTVKSRMQSKIWAADSLNAVTEGSKTVFPLFLREVFVDVVVSLGLRVARCEFEGDMEIAGIAKTLDCPVISYDSDFYMFGCLYIPFSTVDITVRKGKYKKIPYNYISSKIYHIESFLQAYGGLDRNNLPLLAVLLGNDYIKGSLFAPFFKNVKIQKCSGNQSDQQKRIKSIIVWLQNENMESAIKTVLSRFKNARRRLVLKKIQGAMKGYFEVNSELLKYLGIDPASLVDCQIDFEKLKNQEDSCSPENSDSEDASNSEDDNSEDDNDINALTAIFDKKYRSCQYPACFMDMITLNRYYCVPQAEDSSSDHSHTVSLNILNVMYQMLVPKTPKRLNLVYRHNKGIRHTTLPNLDNMDTLTLEDIEEMAVEDRKVILQNSLSVIDNKFSEVINLFPLEWHLFLIALKYAICNGQFDTPLIYSCLICFIILHYVDNTIGFYRVSKTFYKKFAPSLNEIKMEPPKGPENECFTSFDKLPFNDCLLFMDKIIPFFQMDCKLKTNYRLYDKSLVHALSQIQSVFLHVKYLNSLLNYPFPILQIHEIFDGTFLYNMTNNLRKRIDINGYLDMFLKESPCILSGIKHIISTLDSCLGASRLVTQPGKRHRKKKKKDKSNGEILENLVEDEEIEPLIDPNNPYSILAVL